MENMRNNIYIQCIDTGDIMTLTAMAHKYGADKGNIVRCCQGKLKTTKKLRFRYAKNGLYNADCMDVVRQLDDNSIDACITDPPYEIGFMSKDWDNTGITFDKKLWKEVYRTLRDGAYVLAFSDSQNYHKLASTLEQSGFEIRDTISWIYGQGMSAGVNISKQIDKRFGCENKGEIIDIQYKQDIRNANLMSRAVHGKTKKMVHIKRAPYNQLAKKFLGFKANLKPAQELICVARKPIQGALVDNIINNQLGAINLQNESDRLSSNVMLDTQDNFAKYFYCPKVKQDRDNYNDHPTVKPVELMEHLIRLVTVEGQLVLDPFAGSGTTCLACCACNRQYIGIELDEHYFSIAQQRLFAKPNV